MHWVDLLELAPGVRMEKGQVSFVINPSTWQDDLKNGYFTFKHLSSPHSLFPLEISSGTWEQGKLMSVASYVTVKIESYTWQHREWHQLWDLRQNVHATLGTCYSLSYRAGFASWSVEGQNISNVWVLRQIGEMGKHFEGERFIFVDRTIGLLRLGKIFEIIKSNP